MKFSFLIDPRIVVQMRMERNLIIVMIMVDGCGTMIRITKRGENK